MSTKNPRNKNNFPQIRNTPKNVDGLGVQMTDFIVKGRDLQQVLDIHMRGEHTGKGRE